MRLTPVQRFAAVLATRVSRRADRDAFGHVPLVAPHDPPPDDGPTSEDSYRLVAGRAVWRTTAAQLVAAADSLDLTVVDQTTSKRLFTVEIAFTVRGAEGKLAVFAGYVDSSVAASRYVPSGPP